MSSSGPGKNDGSNTALKVREGTGATTSPIYRTYLQFDVSGVTAPVTSAKLRLFTTDASVDGAAIFAVATGWTERGITDANAPAIPSQPIAGAAPPTARSARPRRTRTCDRSWS